MRCSICYSILIVLSTLAGGLADTTNNQPAQVPPEVVADWRFQDGIAAGKTYKDVIPAIITNLGTEAGELQSHLQRLENLAPEDPQWEQLYLDACTVRRAARLRTVLKQTPHIIFTQHYNIGGSHYAYTEGQSDAQDERTFEPGASLCLLSMNGLFGQVRTLIKDPGGVIRDPDVSYDGRRVLFAWKKSLNADDYHLYEYDISTSQVRQLTSGLGFADYEGVYAPNGQIVFNSTRCVQTVDCWWTEVSNLYTCDGDGRYLRRFGFDQVHTNYPTVMPDGRILYTRWEYSDRGQMYVQGLFQMNPDGTSQREFYGNNSWFPTSLIHARGIPGTEKVAAIFTGHHTMQQGWLGTVDPSRGRQENQGTQLISPVRETPAERIDCYGQSGDQFQYPYPLSETEFLVTFKPYGVPVYFGIYWMDQSGQRELLATNSQGPCNQPVPLAARPVPHVRPSMVDYRKTQGLCSIQDIYAGPGLAGVPRGSVKKLRVVALDYRAAGMGANENTGTAGDALICTPIATGNGAWDVKNVLGEATVREDGSVFFAVPSRTPVYFQAIDAKGFAIQSMRSWATLQPGEVASCVGCHESKNAAPPTNVSTSLALKAGAEQLTGFYGPPRGFSFPKEIQPILDRHCIVCHKIPPSENAPPLATEATMPNKLGNEAFSLLGAEVTDVTAKRKWSRAYLTLTASRKESGFDHTNSYRGNPQGSIVNWISAQSDPPMLPPYSAGAAKSRLMPLLEQGHGGVKLSREETDKIACWIDLLVPFCGDYPEANAWSVEELERYSHFLSKRKQMEEIERRNIEAWIHSQAK
jgi:hypothetical protein